MENTGKQPTVRQTGNQPSKLFTKDEVNSLMQKRVERSHNAFFNRYGVNNLDELDGLFGKASSYDQIKAQLDEALAKNNELTSQYNDLNQKFLFHRKNVNPDKINDIQAYFKGKGLDIDEKNLDAELKSHQNWCVKPQTIQTLGPQETPTDTDLSQAQLASKYFGVDLVD